MRLMRERAENLQRLAEVAERFARTLHPGNVVAVRGALGSGKTTFIAQAVRALHGKEEATSPTFTFWHRYDGAPVVHHLDLYRVEGPEDLATIGLEEAFTGDAVVFVEWPERAPHLLPSHSIEVRIAGSGEEPRMLEIARP